MNAELVALRSRAVRVSRKTYDRTLARLAFWPWAVATLALAGIIHILAIFAVPQFAAQPGYDRLAALEEPHAMAILPELAPGEAVLPFQAPDIRYAFCHFDLAEGLLRVEAPLPDVLWSVAVYTAEGENFYTLTGADLRRPRAVLQIGYEDQTTAETDRLLLSLAGDRAESASRQGNAGGGAGTGSGAGAAGSGAGGTSRTGTAATAGAVADEDILTVRAPSLKGLVIIRAPVRGPAYAAGVERALSEARCALVE